jgi:membrane-associated phospholipid phosphatase
MLSLYDWVNIILPVFSHWALWLIFFVFAAIILLLYAYPYIKKPRKEFNAKNIGIPITNVVSLYIFTKMLEGYIYQGSILKVDAWVNGINFTSYLASINSIAMFITNFGGSVGIGILFALALAVLVWKKRWRYAIISSVAILGALILQLAIKALVHRARPENLIETGYSFPSGHAIMSVVFVSLLIYSFKDDIKHQTWRYVLIILAIAFSVAVGISRIILHVHWFSDVIAGMSLGLFWFLLVVLIERSISGLIPAVKLETKKAKPLVSGGPIVSADAVKTVKKVVKRTVKAVIPAAAPSVGKKSAIRKKRK